MRLLFGAITVVLALWAVPGIPVWLHAVLATLILTVVIAEPRLWPCALLAF